MAGDVAGRRRSSESWRCAITPHPRVGEWWLSQMESHVIGGAERDWLSLGFLPACRSGHDEPNGGVAGQIWSSCRKSSLENFFGNEEFDSGGGVLELPGTKVGWPE